MVLVSDRTQTTEVRGKVFRVGTRFCVLFENDQVSRPHYCACALDKEDNMAAIF